MTLLKAYGFNRMPFLLFEYKTKKSIIMNPCLGATSSVAKMR